MRWGTILASLKSSDMRKRLLSVLLMIVAYRFLAHVPVPLAEPTQLKKVIDTVLTGSDFGGFLNLLSGGALASFSIVLVGLSPYITASIITQLMTKVIPKLEELHKDGESGRRKINQWTRMITLPLAIVQSIAFIFILRQTVLAGNTVVLNNTTPVEWVVAVTAMTAGAMLLMWLGELITEEGVGNGISLLIFAGIISQIPQTASTLWTSLTQTTGEKLHILYYTFPIDATSFWVTLALGVISLVVLYILVKINEAQRIIHINYAKRVQGNTAYGGTTSILPVKIITAGVIPVIFAVAFLSLPAFIGQILKATQNPQYTQLADNLVKWFQAPQGGLTTLADGAWVYPAAYFVLVVAFTYFYTGIVFNSDEIAENLQKQGGFISHIRPGLATAKYLKSVVNRLTLFGSIALGVIAILPFIGEYVAAQFGVSVSNLAIGGTGMLIVVSVALEALRQINSRALMVTYDEYK
ncbi:MAG: preprotein translocase subunit SecY [Candidatus Saccharibacteria bacterium]|nr:preprotein translocase subunit SecY [Candidatus Saccharibacteria bacterium]